MNEWPYDFFDSLYFCLCVANKKTKDLSEEEEEDDDQDVDEIGALASAADAWSVNRFTCILSSYVIMCHPNSSLIYSFNHS